MCALDRCLLIWKGDTGEYFSFAYFLFVAPSRGVGRYEADGNANSCCQGKG